MPRLKLMGDSDFCWLSNNLFSGHSRLCFRCEYLKVAAFPQTGTHGSDLAEFFNNEWSAALGARLRDGHVRSIKATIGITKTAIENARSSSSAFSGAAAANEFPFVALWTFDAHGDRPRVFALWII